MEKPPRGPGQRPKVIVGSGWWCNRQRSRWTIGDDMTRVPEFFDLWLHLVRHYVKPDHVVVVDSNSPHKPANISQPGLTWIELDRNYGHANDLRVGEIASKFCGFTRSVLLTAMFALSNDADIYCYVEQDCVVRGDDFIDRALAGREPTILIGAPTQNGVGLGGRIAAPMYQQSLIIVGRASLERFIAGVMRGPESDGEVSPEIKMVRDCAPLDLLAIPYGRSRPINFGLPCYYAQHLTGPELANFLAAEHLSPGDFRLNLL